MSNNSNSQKSFETLLGISVTIVVTSIFVLISILNAISQTTDRVGVLTLEGDLSNWFSLIITMIVSPVLAVWLGVFFYKKQKMDDERRQQTQENQSVINEHRSRLDDIINPLIKNITNLQINYKRYGESTGPYPLSDFKEKDLLIEQLELIVARYNQRTNPDEALIERINEIKNSCKQFPELRTYQFNSKMAMIKDITECRRIHQSFQSLIEDIESQRSSLEEKIGQLSEYNG